MPTSNPWIVRQQALDPRSRLFCLPPAGGGASFFRGWGGRLPESCEVCAVLLPGREQRVREEPFRALEPLVAALVDGLSEEMDLPFAFYGHSMGALLGFELTRSLLRAGLPVPRVLVVSGRRAPHLPLRRRPFHVLDDDALWKKLHEIGGIHPRVFQEAELQALLLPTIRADLELVERHPDRPIVPLPVPIISMASERDDMASVTDLEAWKLHTDREHTLRVFQGGHFFVQTHQVPVLEALSGVLDRIMGGS